MSETATAWLMWARRLVLIAGLAMAGCVVNPVPTPGSSDESPTGQPTDDGTAKDGFTGGGVDAGTNRGPDDIAAPPAADATSTDAATTTADADPAD